MSIDGSILYEWHREALGHLNSGNFPTASMLYRRILSRDPRQVDAWCNLSAALRELGRIDEAKHACEQALALDPGHIPTLSNLGSLLADDGNYESALVIYQKILAIQPDYFPARFQMGWVLYRLGDLEGALESDNLAISLHPDSAAAHLNRGYTLMKLGRLAESECSILRSLELDPSLAVAHWNLAFVRLLDGRLKEAWPEYNWRWQVRDSIQSHRHFDQPEWRGEAFAGRTLLVWAEQGFGDSIQFVRYLPMVKARGGRVVLQVQPALVELFQGCIGVDQVISESESIVAFDLQVPILSLPQVFQSSLEDIPCEIPYLSYPATYVPPSGLVEALKEDDRIRIGLVWCGNPTQKDNPTRSMDPSLFEPLAALPGVAWYSLQKYQSGIEPRGLPMVLQAQDLNPFLNSFTDTAFALERLHLLITVDTSVAHLAGALGCPTAVLLSFSPDWRWLIQGDRCPWYPTFKLYRQPKPGDWESVMRHLVDELCGGRTADE